MTIRCEAIGTQQDRHVNFFADAVAGHGAKLFSQPSTNQGQSVRNGSGNLRSFRIWPREFQPFWHSNAY